jgi:hyaluronoglucosaminidase
MHAPRTFQRRGIVEGFFGPLWSMAHRNALFEFGAARGMNTYLYAPKDDPYHRVHWTRPYPPNLWKQLLQLIRNAQRLEIDFVYGFHPGQGLRFSDSRPVEILLGKTRRFYEAGVRTFAVLFDDIPSHLEHPVDRLHFKRSLARAQGIWLQKILDQQPAMWNDVEWWICPSYYTADPLLARTFGTFEPHFLDTLAEHLPTEVACFWTGPAVVPANITLAHARKVAKQVRHKLILWDNYPVNDLSMSDELHIGPLQGRDRRLPQAVYGYLNNPLLQESLSFVPLATCFDYARNPGKYEANRSWRKIITERFGRDALPHWRAIRSFCEDSQRAKKQKKSMRLAYKDRGRLQIACNYIRDHQQQKWAREIRPWREAMQKMLARMIH